jgi:putative Ig domain-containing protein
VNTCLFIRPFLLAGALVFAWGVSASQTASVEINGQSDAQEGVPRGQREAADLIIESDSPLPETYPHALCEFRFHARGGVPPLHWHVEKGVIPPGLKFEDNGLLHGSPEHAGEFQFTVVVTDSGQPQRSVQKLFVLRVRSAMTLNWKNPAHVNGNRIEGSAVISNTTADDIDLTFIVLAVPQNGRAVAIGYQHFVLRRGTLAQELPFGETLPRGGYVVYMDAVGEVAAKNVIYRTRMQTPTMLQVTVGP